MTFGGDQAEYERLERVTDCDRLLRIADGRSPEFPPTGGRADLGIRRAALQQMYVHGCETPAP